MSRNSFRGVAGAALLMIAGVTQAQETDWLKREAGFVGGLLGARVESVEDVAGSDDQKIVVSVPASAVNEEPVIEEVLVTAPYPDELEVDAALEPRYEFVRDYERDRYGFIIYLGKHQSLPFRLHFMADDSLPMR